ncbi:MAG: F0F1 ATP synthase subunit gamma, partial [Candidatus Eiseniibacteriota bacterium]
AMESFMSENAARVQIMLSARRGIEEKLDALHMDERRLRQEEITTEMLDVVTGAEAARQG